jgi:ABC-type nickel/cobalt efflux system permease component RcnA
VRLSLGLTLGAALALVLALLWAASTDAAAALFHWTAMQQRTVQNAMAGALRAIRAGDGLALAGLCALSGAYGFLHAFGPGHGKVLLGGTALAGGVPFRRMAAIGLVASLGQSLTAIVMVTLGAGLVAAAGGGEALAEGLLAEASRWAIMAIGALIAWRGARALWRLSATALPAPALAPAPAPGGPLPSTGARQGEAPGGHNHGHVHDETCGCGHRHGPTVAEVAALRRPREVAALIFAVAIRPCTGALFLLAIAFGLGIPLAGILAVLAMGLGTAAFNLLAIAGGGLLGRMLRVEAWHGGGSGAAMAGAGLQLAAGAAIVLLTLGLAL